MRAERYYPPQVAHDVARHEPHAPLLPPAPFSGPLLLLAKKVESARWVASLPHSGHWIGASMSRIARRALNFCVHC